MTTENRLLRAYGQGCARGALLYAVIAVIVLSGFCCLSAGAYALPVEDDIRLWIWVGLIILFMFTVIGITVVWAVLTIRRRGRQLDEVFTPFGLEGRGYLTNGRQYHGIYRGYPMHVYFYRGPTLQIYIDAPLRTRLGIGRKSELARLAGNLIERDVLELDAPEFEHLAIYSDDPRWAKDLFADHQARETVSRLTNEESAVEVRTLSVTPKALLWQSRYLQMRHINAENVRAWINDLYELVRIAQGLLPPTVTAVESDLERLTRTDRSRYTWPVVGITCGVFAALAGCILAISAFVIILAESGL